MPAIKMSAGSPAAVARVSVVSGDGEPVGEAIAATLDDVLSELKALRDVLGLILEQVSGSW